MTLIDVAVWIILYIPFVEHANALLLGMYPGELMDHSAYIYLFLEDSTKQFSSVVKANLQLTYNGNIIVTTAVLVVSHLCQH